MQLKEIFENDSEVSIANRVEPPGERGAGGFEIFPLVDWYYLGLTITVAIVGKSFFDELGRGLAKKLLAILFEKPSPTKFIVSNQKRTIEIIIPSNTDISHMADIEAFLKGFEKHKGGKCFYSSETKSFVYIEEYEDVDPDNPKG